MKNFTLKKIFGLIVSVVLIAQNAFAQPPNDGCAGALSTTPNGTCYGPGLPQTTTVGATDGWIGQVACAGNNDEVWFTFVATGTTLNINVTNGTMGGNIEFVLVEASGPCAGLTLEGSLCGASPLTGLVSNSLTVGATYYYTISSTGADGTFTTCVTNTTPPPTPGQDCPSAAPLCDNATFSQGVFSGVGVAENISTNSCFGGNERQSKWYTFTAGTSGTFNMMINPNVSTDDYDFALWNTTGGCYTAGTTMGVPLSCNWSGCAGTTGIATDPVTTFGSTGGLAVGQWQNNNPPGPGTCDPGPFQWSPTINLVAGQTYTMLIDNFSATSGGFSVNFGGTATIGQPANFTTSLDVTCLTLSVNHSPFYTGPNSTYLWNYGDGFTSTSGTPGPHTYLSTGTYTVSLTVTDAIGCVKTFSVPVNVGCLLPIELSEFKAVAIDNERVDINWTTVSEDNNDFFTVEKSKDGETFEEVGTIDGAGTTQSAQVYAFIDRSPYSGVSYYRLKQTDFDGMFSYSDFQTVFIETALSDLSIYPNPVKGNSKVMFELGASGQVNLVVSDLSGKSLIASEHKVVLGSNTIDVNTSQLTTGMYLLTVNNATESKTIRFVVK